MPYCEDHKIFYKIDCSSCLHELNKWGKQLDKEMANHKALIAKQKAAQSKPKAKPKPVSEKRKELNKEYFKLVEQFKKDNPECKAKVNEYCTVATEDTHHRKGRGRYLNDISTWLAVCRSCHSYIEAHPEEAKERGWSESRLAIDQSKQTI